MRSNLRLTIILLSAVLSCFFPAELHAQKITRVQGKIIDAQTKEPLPFVSVVFEGKNIGTNTDFDGKYNLETQWASGKIQVSCLGYHPASKDIIIGKNQVVDFELEPTMVRIEGVEVVAKKKRYKNKNNPAVELIKKVIDHKATNRKENFDFVEYDKYKKVEFDLNNITDQFRERRALKDFQFIFDHIDTSEVNGKPYLPVFLEETLSHIYYRKSPKTKKEHISGSKMIGFEDYIDTDGIDIILENMYQDVNLYDNNIVFLTNQFVSPISSTAPLVYKFHIMDTLEYKGTSVIDLAFRPRNEQDLAFIGNMYITNDQHYNLVKAEMKFSDGINLNFINDLHILQEFENHGDSCWLMDKESLIVDYNIGERSLGIFGKKTIHYDNYKLNENRPDSLYNGVETVIKEPGYEERDSLFWHQNRLVELSEKEKGIYTMVDSIYEVPSFTRALDVLKFVMVGYINMGPIDIGPFNSLYSFNDVEGARLRIGGRTSDEFSKRFRVDGYLMYGFGDERFKYSGGVTWALNDQPIVSKKRHTVNLLIKRGTKFPGMDLELVSEGNFFLSFTRGVADKMIYYDLVKMEHVRDWAGGITTTTSFSKMNQAPGGMLKFEGENFVLNKINSTEISTTIRFAPNQKFYQGITYRTQLDTKYPILTFSYTQGIKGLFAADHTYSKLRFNIYKRFAVSPIGNTYVEAEAGKIFGEGLPFPLLSIPRANQTYAYQFRSYNLMNFLEFISDQYVSLSVEHHFYGFLFNKIPLIKHLKFREVVSFKGLYGGISDENNPAVTPGLLAFPTDAEGNTSTFLFGNKPYMEVSVGVENIFKFFRVDLVKRLTYLDNPNVSSLGVRAKLKFDF